MESEVVVKYLECYWMKYFLLSA